MTHAGTPKLDCDARAHSKARKLARASTTALLGFAVLSLFALIAQHRRFIHAYFVAFGFLTTLALGALFFTLLHYLLNARWSLSSLRRVQPLMGLLPYCGLLFLPTLLWQREIFASLGAPDRAEAHWPGTAGNLTFSWFTVRAAFYWVVWIGLALLFRGASSNGNSEPNRRIRRCHKASGPGMILFAVSITFASFDWFMNIQPNWHSAVFGVYVFAGSVTSALAVLAIVTVLLERLEVIAAKPNARTRHDIGKLLFGFVMFWAYIAFSQYLLVWYAGLRSETPFFALRFNREWLSITLWLFTLQFVIPFVALLSASAKRSAFVLGGVSVIVVLAHAIDFFWLVMPALESGNSRLCFADIPAALLAISALLRVVSKGIENEFTWRELERTWESLRTVESQLELAG